MEGTLEGALRQQGEVEGEAGVGAGTPADLERWSATGRSGRRSQGHTALIMGFGLQGAASPLSQLPPPSEGDSASPRRCHCASITCVQRQR